MDEVDRQWRICEQGLVIYQDEGRRPGVEFRNDSGVQVGVRDGSAHPGTGATEEEQMGPGGGGERESQHETR